MGRAARLVSPGCTAGGAHGLDLSQRSVQFSFSVDRVARNLLQSSPCSVGLRKDRNQITCADQARRGSGEEWS
jgi:hypothetical protein